MKRLLWLLPLILLLGLGYWGFHRLFEWSEENRDLGLAEPALRNPYLAAQRLLEKDGSPVSVELSLKRLDALPGPETLLFVPQLPAYLEPARAEALRAWLEAGGHLLTVYRRDSREDEADAERPFLEQYGLRRHSEEADEDDESTAEDEAKAVEQLGELGRALGLKPEGKTTPDSPEERRKLAETWLKTLTELRFEGHEQSLRLNVAPYTEAWLEDGDEAAAASGDTETRTTLLHYTPGEGSLTVLLDDAFLKNEQLAQFDHALFLTELADGRPVLILNAGDYPSLPELLASRYPEALAAAALLLTFWLWRITGRFGPLRPDVPPARRSLAEHLAAAGRFHWRSDRGAALLEGLRAELHKTLTRRHGAWPDWSEDERLAWLAAQTGMPDYALRAALFDPPPREELAWSEAARGLQTLKSLL
ncbi:MAG: DUF4350 domain-containing protein [Gammaproteobacteria bacterium]|nr:DUF4350 domain-containing protein [Gammaproteobacteria bacterium]